MSCFSFLSLVYYFWVQNPPVAFCCKMYIVRKGDFRYWKMFPIYLYSRCFLIPALSPDVVWIFRMPSCRYPPGHLSDNRSVSILAQWPKNSDIPVHYETFLSLFLSLEWLPSFPPSTLSWGWQFRKRENFSPGSFTEIVWYTDGVRKFRQKTFKHAPDKVRNAEAPQPLHDVFKILWSCRISNKNFTFILVPSSAQQNIGFKRVYD